MSMLCTSRIICELKENDEEDCVREDMDYATDLFRDFFASRENFAIDEQGLRHFMHACEILWNKGVFSSMARPESNDYFAKETRNLQMKRFLSTFFSYMDKSYIVKGAEYNIMLPFFKKIGDFYFFLNYLDVHESVLLFFKTMLALYCVEMGNRTVIEETFENILGALDDFFVNEVLVDLYNHCEKYVRAAPRSHFSQAERRMPFLDGGGGVCLHAQITGAVNQQCIMFLAIVGPGVETKMVDEFMKTVDPNDKANVATAFLQFSADTGNVEFLKTVMCAVEHEIVVTPQNIKILMMSRNADIARYLHFLERYDTKVCDVFAKVKARYMEENNIRSNRVNLYSCW